jgi:hypothetical protein
MKPNSSIQPPVPRLTSELIIGAHKVFVAGCKGMQAALASEPDADVIAPTEVDVPTEIMKCADGLMVVHQSEKLPTRRLTKGKEPQ